MRESLTDFGNFSRFGKSLGYFSEVKIFKYTKTHEIVHLKMKTKLIICEDCTNRKFNQYIRDNGGDKVFNVFGLYGLNRNDIADHRKLHRNDKWFKGIKPVYMKRVYIRETIKKKQHLKEYGYVCLECDRVIVTMRKNLRKSSNYVSIVRK